MLPHGVEWTSKNSVAVKVLKDVKFVLDILSDNEFHNYSIKNKEKNFNIIISRYILRDSMYIYGN